MTIRSKLIIAGTILAASIAYLALAGVRSGWVYFLEVDRYLADASFQSQRVRLHGKVCDDDSVSVSSATLLAKFNLSGKSQKLAVAYHGAIPDMFQAGREVVVEGKLDPATHTFNADVLMTKCASKYESSSPHAGNRGGAKESAERAS
jgi:cytochrome c-type biogenesis protein CcmE